ncbi:hypothetical protein SO802_028217 [Lithocarpus litseifolius]|uniref:Uncharacterized protein n=1 Tax=Lithocarpus litseifolius TaxID=425828 RepID=A0AAW2BRK1_9ROSI
MAKISRASSSSSTSTSTLSMEMGFLVAEDLDFVQVEEQGLSHWEFVNVSDADDSEKENSEKVESEEDKYERIGDGFGSLGFEKDETMVTTSTTHHVDLDDDHRHGHDYDVGLKFQGGNRSYGYGYGYDDEEENDDDEDDGEDDFDDELVPWDVSGKFGRQRMRKLGKRAFPKMYNSKRSPYLFVRPGCVRGKHGMGMKHNC